MFLFGWWMNFVLIFWCVGEFKVLSVSLCAWAGGESAAGSSGTTVPVGPSLSYTMAIGTRRRGRQ